MVEFSDETRTEAFERVVVSIFEKAGMTCASSFASEDGQFMLEMVRQELGRVKKGKESEIFEEEIARIAEILVRFKKNMEGTVRSRRAAVRGALRRVLKPISLSDARKKADALLRRIGLIAELGGSTSLRTVDPVEMMRGHLVEFLVRRRIIPSDKDQQILDIGRAFDADLEGVLVKYRERIDRVLPLE